MSWNLRGGFSCSPDTYFGENSYDSFDFPSERKGLLENVGEMPLQSYGGDQTMDIRPRDDFVSPSALKADTDQYSQWPVCHDTMHRADVTSYNPDTEQFNEDEGGYSVRNAINQANPNGSQSCKEPSIEQRSKRLQSCNGPVNGFSLISKDRVRFTVSPSRREHLVQLRTASRKAKRTSVSYKPANSPEEERTRNSHNLVETQLGPISVFGRISAYSTQGEKACSRLARLGFLAAYGL